MPTLAPASPGHPMHTHPRSRRRHSHLRPWAERSCEKILKTHRDRVEAVGMPVDAASFDSYFERICDWVVAEAMNWHADLIVIVLGTHGRRGVGNVFMGSDAEHIVHLAPTPVLVVHSAKAASVGPTLAATPMR